MGVAEHHNIRLFAKDSNLYLVGRHSNVHDMVNQELSVAQGHNLSRPIIQTVVRVADYRRYGRD